MDAEDEDPPPPPPPVSPPPDLPGLYPVEDSVQEEREEEEDAADLQVSLFLDDQPSSTAAEPATPTPEGTPPAVHVELFADDDTPPPPAPADSPPSPPSPRYSPPPSPPPIGPPPDLPSVEEAEQLFEEASYPPSPPSPPLHDVPELDAVAVMKDEECSAVSGDPVDQVSEYSQEEADTPSRASSSVTEDHSPSPAPHRLSPERDHHPLPATATDSFLLTDTDRTPPLRKEALSMIDDVASHTPPSSKHTVDLTEHDASHTSDWLTPSATPVSVGEGDEDTSDSMFTHSRHPVSTTPTVIDVIVLEHDEDPYEADLPPLPSSLPPDLPSSPPPDLPASPVPDIPAVLVTEETDSSLLSILTVEQNGSPQPAEEEEKPVDMSSFHEKPSINADPFMRPERPSPRTTRSYSTIVQGSSQDYLMQPNLKRWDATDLVDISQQEVSPDESDTQVNYNELRAVRSAIEVTSRPRTSSGVSWLSTGTSLESISEGDQTDHRLTNGKVTRHPYSDMSSEQEIDRHELAAATGTDNIVSDSKTSPSLITRPRSRNILMYSKVPSDNAERQLPAHRPFSYTETTPRIPTFDQPSPPSPPLSLPLNNDPPPPSQPPPSQPPPSQSPPPDFDRSDFSSVAESMDTSERTLERIGKDMPKSMSSLLNSVVSDIPSLLQVDSEETELPTATKTSDHPDNDETDTAPTKEKPVQQSTPPPLPPPRVSCSVLKVDVLSVMEIFVHLLQAISPAKWSVSEVGNWLMKNGFEDCVTPFTS